ncbi:MAG: hypothetical protein GX801_11945 [Fibrobacter sp.]|nr:hypothetical protein [Fibrobacter sp.]
MKVIEKKAKNNWDFILFKTDECFALNVVFHSSATDYSRSFRLNSDEASLDFEGLKKLSEQIRNNYELYKNREITPTVRMPKDS